MKVTLKKKNKNQKTITFNKGGLHESTHTPMGEKISAPKMAAAKSGEYGAKAKRQALFAANILTGGH